MCDKLVLHPICRLGKDNIKTKTVTKIRHGNINAYT